MPSFLKAHEGSIYAVVRIVTGFTFLCHGLQKFGVLAGGPDQLNAMLWAAAVIELVGGGLIMVGFRAGWAAFICSGQMAVAYFLAHQGRGALPIANGGELAVLYCFIFLYIAARGSGKWSADGGVS